MAVVARLGGAEGEAWPANIARLAGVSRASPTKAIARLMDLGLAQSRPYRRVFLTEAGQAATVRLRERQLILRHALRVIGISPDAAEQQASLLPQHVSEPVPGAMSMFLRGRQAVARRVSVE